MFQLKTRLERVQVPDSLEHNDMDDEPAVIELQEKDAAELQPVALDAAAAHFALRDHAEQCGDKPATGNRTLRACFGRRRTHNEELCVGSCGVILGRATMFGSEAPNGVRVSCLLSSVLSWMSDILL
jgi:hypothetical protein